MSSMVLSGDTSGTVTVTVPAVAGTNTATLPAATGTVMVSGNMPAFSYYANATQNISIGAWTKVLFQTKEFDTNNNVSSSTFTPTVAGYYQINSTVAFAATASSGEAIALYKNGTINKIGTYALNGNIGNRISSNFLIYCNGSTDYIEIYAINNTAASPLATQAGGATDTYFQGFMVRAA